MRVIKLYEEFNYHTHIDAICKRYGITNYTINEDGTIDVDRHIDISHRSLTKFPLKFGKVSGYFNCASNKLTSFEGGPKYVGGGFYCNDNQLTNFEGCPDYVDHFICRDNPFEVLWNLFEDYQYMELFIDLDIVRDGNIIILQRLNEFLDMIGEPSGVTSVDGYKCI